MEITQLRYFLEVASTQHITRSAEKLHIAQPALSQSIKRLEDSLGVPLFVSKGRNIKLTRYGEYLQTKAKPLIEEFDAIPNQLKRIANIDNTTTNITNAIKTPILSKKSFIFNFICLVCFFAICIVFSPSCSIVHNFFLIRFFSR